MLRERPNRSFGHDLVGQYWTFDLVVEVMPIL